MPRTTKPKPKQVQIPVPKPVQKSIPKHVPTQVPVQRQNHSMFETMKQGFSFGVGSSIANNMTNRIFNSKDKDENASLPAGEMHLTACAKSQLEQSSNRHTSREDINKEENKLTTDKRYELYNKCLEKNDKNIDCNIILQKNTIN